MELRKKESRNSHRGIIGVESAIVMIAFVIVAAALAFVVLNMGFSTTQKAKTTIGASLDEASGALEISGKVFGLGHISVAKLNVTAAPLKVVSGGSSVNLAKSTTTIKYLSNEITLDNIYKCTLSTTSFGSLSAALIQAKTQGCISNNPKAGEGFPNATSGIIYWSVNNNANTIIDEGEHVVLAIVYKDTERPLALDKVRAEIIVPAGPTLTLERQVPSITNEIVDLG